MLRVSHVSEPGEGGRNSRCAGDAPFQHRSRIAQDLPAPPETLRDDARRPIVRPVARAADGRLTRIQATLAEHGVTLSEHSATLAGIGERPTRIQATQNELRVRMDGLEAGLHAVRDNLAHTNERMARVDGTVAGALGRPFPELMAQAPDMAAAE